MEGANHEDSLLMKDAQDENDGRERGKAGWWSAALSHSHVMAPHRPLFISIVLVSGMMLNPGKDTKVKR